MAALATVAARAVEVPFLTGRVVDEGAFFDGADEARMEERLAAIEQQTGAQMVVLTVDSLGGDPLEDYSMRVVETWELGSSERDDGLLLLISRDERALRLEVGYGLEGAITDVQSRRILDRIITPAFRSGDFAGGALGAIDAVAALLDGEEPQALRETTPEILRHPMTRLLGFLLFWMIISMVLRIVMGRRRGRRWSSRGGWLPPIVLGGGSGRSWSGGGFSSGGFSGGGGSFGGGGASGGW